MVYTVIINAINNMYRTIYMHIETYLKYIVDAPSTINRIAKYYAIGFREGKSNEVYIMFNSKIVKIYTINIPKVNYREVTPCFGQ